MPCTLLQNYLPSQISEKASQIDEKAPIFRNSVHIPSRTPQRTDPLRFPFSHLTCSFPHLPFRPFSPKSSLIRNGLFHEFLKSPYPSEPIIHERCGRTQHSSPSPQANLPDKTSSSLHKKTSHTNQSLSLDPCGRSYRFRETVFQYFSQPLLLRSRASVPASRYGNIRQNPPAPQHSRFCTET